MSLCHIAVTVETDNVDTIYSFLRKATQSCDTVVLIIGSQNAEVLGSHLLKSLTLDLVAKVRVLTPTDHNASASLLQVLSQVRFDVAIVSEVGTQPTSELYRIVKEAVATDPSSFAFPMGPASDGLDRINLFHADFVAFSKDIIHTLQRIKPSTPLTFLHTLKAELYRHGEGRVVMNSDESHTNLREISSPIRYLGVPPVLSIVVPTLDAASEKTRSLIASLRVSTEDPFQVIVVDNGNAPQGFSAPVNTAIRACNTPYVVVINDDVQVLPHWWSPLKAALDDGELVVFPTTIETTRYDFSAWCFAMTAHAVNEIAFSAEFFFDPELVIYFQDSDLLMRLRSWGKPPKHVQESYISHRFSATIMTKDPELSSWINRVIVSDRDRFVKRWGPEALVEVGFSATLQDA